MIVKVSNFFETLATGIARIAVNKGKPISVLHYNFFQLQFSVPLSVTSDQSNFMNSFVVSSSFGFLLMLFFSLVFFYFFFLPMIYGINQVDLNFFDFLVLLHSFFSRPSSNSNFQSLFHQENQNQLWLGINCSRRLLLLLFLFSNYFSVSEFIRSLCVLYMSCCSRGEMSKYKREEVGKVLKQQQHQQKSSAWSRIQDAVGVFRRKRES